MIKRIEREVPDAPVELARLKLLNEQLGRRLQLHESEMDAAAAGLDSLAHSISHDLRSPLNIITGFAELLTKHSGSGLDEKGQRFLTRITAAAVKIGRMMDEFLALATVSRSEMHLVPVDFGSLVRKVVHDFDADKGDRRVVWIIGSLPLIRADPTLLKDAISSLASNALKFTRSREVARIQIGAQAGDDELTCFVRDNGASFDIKHRERFFDATPGHHDSTEPNCGAIRLAHVQRIIQRHGGRMWTEAVPDGGASFFFTLPTDSVEPVSTQGPQ